MAEKIVILGNGFDLRHFLPTKYDHLITILKVIENIKFGNEVETDFDELFGNLFKEKDKWFFEKINEYYETKNIYFETVNLKSIQERLKTNKWYKHFKSVEENQIKSWIDFEEEIKNVLRVFTIFFDKCSGKHLYNYIKSNTYNNVTTFSNDLSSGYSLFDNIFEKNIFFNFLVFKKYKSNPSHIYLDDKYVFAIDNKIQYLKEDLILNDLYESLDDFISIFNDYFGVIIFPFYNQIKIEKSTYFIHNNRNYLFDSVKQIYSFNYTNSYENFYFKQSRKMYFSKGSSGPLTKIDYVHGSINNNWSKLNEINLVLGVDEIDSKMKEYKMFQFTKYFQKLFKNTDYRFLQFIKDRNKTESNIHFYFWGHSLDISDKEYIKEVFSQTKNSNGKIIIFYHSISGKASQLRNLLRIIDKNIIEDFMKEKRLIFIESTPDNLFKELA